MRAYLATSIQIIPSFVLVFIVKKIQTGSFSFQLINSSFIIEDDHLSELN